MKLYLTTRPSLLLPARNFFVRTWATWGSLWYHTQSTKSRIRKDSKWWVKKTNRRKKTKKNRFPFFCSSRWWPSSSKRNNASGTRNSNVSLELLQYAVFYLFYCLGSGALDVFFLFLRWRFMHWCIYIYICQAMFSVKMDHKSFERSIGGMTLNIFGKVWL